MCQQLIAFLSFFLLCLNQEQPLKKLIRGKLVYNTCATAIIQIKDPSYFHLGQKIWQKTPSDVEYEHVFTVKNRCQLVSANIQTNEEFLFEVAKEDIEETNCAKCILYDYPPDSILTIGSTRKLY